MSRKDLPIAKRAHIQFLDPSRLRQPAPAPMEDQTPERPGRRLKPMAGQLIVARHSVGNVARSFTDEHGETHRIWRPDAEMETARTFNPYATVLAVGDPVLQYGERIASPVKEGDEVVLRQAGNVELTLKRPDTGEELVVTIVPFIGGILAVWADETEDADGDEPAM